jgi:hypothetical protein
MTKKSFKAAAKIVAAERIPGFVKTDPYLRYIIAHAFVEFFKSEDSNFDKDRFLAECGEIIE